MKNILTFTLLLLFLPKGIYAQENNSDLVKPEENLVGEWTIDLRPTPESEGYFQAFVVTTIEEKSFKGTFYGSAIENSLINSNWDKLYFAFTTRDQSNAYYHSGYLLDRVLFGMTYCPNRDFAAPWTGLKK